MSHAAPVQLREAFAPIMGDDKRFHASGGYSPTIGLPECRSAIADYAKHVFGGEHEAGPENITLGCNSTQLTFSLMHIMLSQGEKLSLPDPTYCNFPSQVATLEDVRIMRFPLLDVGRWRSVAGERIDAFGAFILDELNHASIIDGIRLCKAQRYRYRNNNLADLEAKLNERVAARFRLIATDGVFSIDGHIANLAGICGLAGSIKRW